MKRLTNITSETLQRHLILFEDDGVVTLTLRFYPKTQHWAFDAEYKGRSVYGVKLSVGVLHIKSKNFPFDFFVVDGSGLGIDPFQRNDFHSGRCNIYIMETDDMLEIRNGAEASV